MVNPWYRNTDGKLVGYGKYDNAAQFTSSRYVADGYSWTTTNNSGVVTTYTIHKFDSATTIINEIEKTGTKLFGEGDLSKFGLTKAKLKDSKYADLAVFVTETQVGGNASTFALGLPSDSFMLANTSGTISTSNAKCKDGNNVYYKLYSGRIVSTFSED